MKKFFPKNQARYEVLRPIWLRLKKHWPLILCTVLLAAVSVITALFVPILIGYAIDGIVAAGQVQINKVVYYLLWAAALFLAGGCAQWLMTRCNNRIAFLVAHDLRNDAFKTLISLPLKSIDRRPVGDFVSRVVSDVDTFTDGLLLGFTQLFTGVLTILGTLIFMFYIRPVIAVLVVILTPLSIFAANFIAKHTYQMFSKQTKTRGEQTAFINEMVGNLKLVQTFTRQQQTQDEFDNINEQFYQNSLKAVFYSSITNPTTRFINNVVYAVVALVGAFSVISGGITVGLLSGLLSYANQYTKPFNEISGVVVELQNALACAERIFELINAKTEPDESGLKNLGTVAGAVELNGVDFSYLPSRPLIENLNLSVKSGQRVAIVGPTGCGKTTLINLLMRFYDVDGGTITVDGQNINAVTRRSLRQNIGMVLQDTWLKTGTVKENIALGNPAATEQEIIAAAKLAHADGFIRRLPQGYSTVVGESGVNLSNGQQQLLSIARVMLCLPPMLILDEATSSIDTRTEIKINNAFDKMMQGRTSFVVAHRLSTVRNADVILVMKSGKIVEQGNHEQLMKQNGLYAAMYREMK